MAKKGKSRIGPWLRRLAMFVVALGVVGMIVYAMLPKPVGVDLGTVERGPLEVTVDEDGRTRIKEQYIVSAPLSGRLLRIGLDVGDEVIAGQTPIARIEPTDPALLDPRAQAQSEARVKAAEARLKQSATQLERAKASMDFAESELARVRNLREKSAATAAQLDQRQMEFRTTTEDFRAAKFAEEIAEFELQLEQAALLRTQEATSDGEDDPGNGSGQFVILAPISGRVLKLSQESATIVTPGTQLMQLGDPSDLEVVVDVLSRDAVRIVPGARAELDQWGGDDPLNATVRLIEPSGFTKISALGVEEQRVNVILDLDDAPEDRITLGDNFRVEAHIIVWEEPTVVKVSNSALFRHEGDWSVFRLNDTHARLQPIVLGHQNSLESEIVIGLAKGDRIVLHPSDQVTDGVEVFER